MSESAEAAVPMKEGMVLEVGVKFARCIKWDNVVDSTSPTGYGGIDYAVGPAEIWVKMGNDQPMFKVYQRGDR